MKGTKRVKSSRIDINKNSSPSDKLFEETQKGKAGGIKEENNFKLNLININVSEPKKNLYIPNNLEQVLNVNEFK